MSKSESEPSFENNSKFSLPKSKSMIDWSSLVQIRDDRGFRFEKMKPIRWFWIGYGFMNILLPDLYLVLHVKYPIILNFRATWNKWCISVFAGLLPFALEPCYSWLPLATIMLVPWTGRSPYSVQIVIVATVSEGVRHFSDSHSATEDGHSHYIYISTTPFLVGFDTY